MNTPACIRCGKSKHVVGHSAGWYCHDCRAIFDDQPDEGGTHSDHNPAARLERAERQRERINRR